MSMLRPFPNYSESGCAIHELGCRGIVSIFSLQRYCGRLVCVKEKPGSVSSEQWAMAAGHSSVLPHLCRCRSGSRPSRLRCRPSPARPPPLLQCLFERGPCLCSAACAGRERRERGSQRSVKQNHRGFIRFCHQQQGAAIFQRP